MHAFCCLFFFRNKFFKKYFRIHADNVHQSETDQDQCFIGSAVTRPVVVFLNRDSGVSGLNLTCSTLLCP